MQIKLTSVFVDDQEKALKFYTEVLGFQKKHGFPGGREIQMAYGGLPRRTGRRATGS
jgi:catechol 2,3-dioxygenase-like lactoylglutathione lyase family enzyme